jgi:hypothetical protein
MTRHIPPEVESAVAERGTLTDKLLVALIEAVNEQNAIHEDLGDISWQLGQVRTEVHSDLMVVAANVAELRR